MGAGIYIWLLGGRRIAGSKYTAQRLNRARGPVQVGEACPWTWVELPSHSCRKGPAMAVSPAEGLGRRWECQSGPKEKQTVCMHPVLSGLGLVVTALSGTSLRESTETDVPLSCPWALAGTPLCRPSDKSPACLSFDDFSLAKGQSCRSYVSAGVC